MSDKVKCLYCETQNDAQNEVCQQCAMALPKRHPQAEMSLRTKFIGAFIFIVIFCLLAMVYLPR